MTQSYGCQQVLLHPNPDLQAILEYACGEANKVYNCAAYYARQVWFKERRYVGRSELFYHLKWNSHFQALFSDVAQQVCLSVVEGFKSFESLLKLHHQGQLHFRPKPPSYRKSGGFYTLPYPKRDIKLKEQGIRCPLGKKVKAWFGIDAFYIPMPSNLYWDSIRELHILPRNGCFYAEFVYKTETQPVKVDPDQALGIDHGIDNWLTCVDTQGNSFIVEGRHLKSVNQWYNKRVATLKENQPQGFWSKQLSRITERRNRQMKDAINKAARLVVNHCIERGIGTIVFGWNTGQKQASKMGRKTNQQFVQIPTARLKARIKQLCQQYGLRFVETEESYTSKASFLDGDSLPTYGEKPDAWEPSGQRVKRGLYRTGEGYPINADSNGAANMLRKVATTLGLCLEGVSRGALTTPLRVRFWIAKKSPSL